MGVYEKYPRRGEDKQRGNKISKVTKTTEKTSSSWTRGKGCKYFSGGTLQGLVSVGGRNYFIYKRMCKM